MGWVRFDDGFADHPKILSLGRDAGYGIALHVAACCYASRHLTDGFLPAAQVARLLPGTSATRIADRLLTVGLWEQAIGGFLIHDYLSYNPSRQKVLDERQKARQRRGNVA